MYAKLVGLQIILPIFNKLTFTKCPSSLKNNFAKKLWIENIVNCVSIREQQEMGELKVL